MPSPPVLTFRTPPGWPTPDAAWQEHFAGWRPGPGWLLDGAAGPAPVGWRFWRPGPGWAALLLPMTRVARRRVLVRAAVTGTGLVGAVMLLGRSGSAGVVGAVCGGAAVLGAAGAVHGARQLAAARRMLLDALHDRADYRMTTGRGTVPE